MSLDLLESEDRGFLTWAATMARVPLSELWARLQADGDTALTADGRQLERLDLSILGSALRDRVGSRRLTLPLGGLDALVALNCAGLSLDTLDLRPVRGLRELRCAENRLVALDLRELSALVTVDVRGNPLASLLLGDHPAMEQILRDP